MKQSWITSANDPLGDFPLINLPYGVFNEEGGAPRCKRKAGANITVDQALDHGYVTGNDLIRCNMQLALRDRPWGWSKGFDNSTVVGTITPMLGDLVFTGTQSGVGPLGVGNVCTLAIDGLAPVTTTIGPPV